MAVRTAWAICSATGWWSAFGKPRRGTGGRPGPPVHKDRVNRVFSAPAPNQLWLTDITEHRTSEGKLDLCAVKDVHSNRIVGYSIDSRMKSRLAVAAIDNAVARRAADGAQVAGCTVHSDPRIAISQPKVRAHPEPPPAVRIDGPGRRSRGQRRHGELLPTPAEERPRPPALDQSPGAADRDRHLDRTDLPPPTPAGRPRSTDAHRVRDHHPHTGSSGCLTRPVTWSCSSPVRRSA